MIFELTDSLVNQIIFAMENQNQVSALDVQNMCIVDAGSVEVDEDKIYLLPEWTSHDGYALLESFVSSIRWSKAYKELSTVLAEGRGVFRQFKNALKKYPENERKFNLLKNSRMKSRVVGWYNELRMSWGLEKLSQDFDECDDLIQEDFVIRPYNRVSDSGFVMTEAKHFSDELKTQYSGELGQALSAIFEEGSLIQSLESKDTQGLVCQTLEDDFAGCILYSPVLSAAKTAVSLTALFVNQNYRGLGIAGELIERSISNLQKNGIHFFIIPNSVLVFELEPLLTRLGFNRTGTAMVAELN